jgi:hypothetical protein
MSELVVPLEEARTVRARIMLGLAIGAAAFAAMFFIGRETGGSATQTKVVRTGGGKAAVVVSAAKSPKLVSISGAASIPNLVSPPRPSTPSYGGSSSGGGGYSGGGGSGGGGGSSGGAGGGSGGAGGG